MFVVWNCFRFAIKKISKSLFIRILYVLLILCFNIPSELKSLEDKKRILLNNDVEITLGNIDNEVITVTGFQNFSLNTVFSPNLFSQSTSNNSVDLLKSIPGFTSIRSGGTNSDLMFRGMFGSRLRILMGNSEIFGACSARMDTPGAYIFSENFDVITLIKGPQTVLWGPVASGGIIRFDRYSPHYYQPEMRIRHSTMFGSYGRVDKNIDTVFGNSSGYFRLIGTMSHSGDYQDANKNIIPSAWDKWNTNMTVGLIPVMDLLFECSITQGNGNAQYAGRSMDSMCFAHDSFEIRFKKSIVSSILDNIDITAWKHYTNHIMGSRVNQDCNSINVMNLNNVDRYTLGTRSILNFQWYDIQIYGGTDIQINQHRKKINNNWKKDSYFQDTGLFSELCWSLEELHKIIFGLRLEHSLVNNYSQDTKRRIEIYPSSFLRYENVFQFPLLNNYIGLAFSERFPDYWELMTLKSGKGIGRDAFYRLHREKNMQLDIGTQFKSDKLDTWISSYVSHVKDFILYHYNTFELDENQVINGSYSKNIDAITYGAEVGVEYRLSDIWNVQGDFFWIFGHNITNQCPLPQIPPMEGQIVLGWKYNLWTGKYIWRVVGSQSRISVHEGNILNQDLIVSSGFSVFSVSVSRYLFENIQFDLGVNNLLNKSYREHLNLMGNKRFSNLSDYTLSEPGRTWWIKVGFNFK